MEDKKINFIPQETRSNSFFRPGNIEDREKERVLEELYAEESVRGPIVQPKRRGWNWGKVFMSLLIIFIIFIIVFSSSIVFSNEGLFKNLSKLNLVGQMGNLISSGDKKLQGEEADRVNILLIGGGGKNHEGGTLADTIILLSYKPSTKQVALMSIPRDLRVKTDQYGYSKINAITAYAEKDKSGSGGEALSRELETLFDTSIPYYVTIDFDGFEKLINEFGGVDVCVDNDLIDYQYPIRGRENAWPIESRFEKLVIKKGCQHMDGKTALKYARSRHAMGLEGSDFARSARQQKIISAMKEKVISANTFINPKKINSLLTAYNENVTTNLQMWELLRLANIGKDVDSSTIINESLTNAADGLLYSNMIDGAYVLLPKGGNFKIIQALWAEIFNTNRTKVDLPNDKNYDIYSIAKERNQSSSTASSTKATTTKATTTAPVVPKPTNLYEEQPIEDLTENYKTEGAKIEIQNGTLITGWATTEKNKLTQKGFTVTKAGNAALRDYKSITIYDLSKGKYPQTVSELTKLYGGNVSLTPPASLKSSADIVIVLGK